MACHARSASLGTIPGEGAVHPEIAQVAVIRSSDTRMGETGMVC